MYYNDKVMNIFNNITKESKVKKANAIFCDVNESCGDTVKFFLKIKNNIIVDASYKTLGCTASIVCSSIIVNIVKNKTIEEANNINCNDVLSQIGELPEQKINCCIFVVETLKGTIKKYFLDIEKAKKKKLKKNNKIKIEDANIKPSKDESEKNKSIQTVLTKLKKLNQINIKNTKN